MIFELPPTVTQPLISLRRKLIELTFAFLKSSSAVGRGRRTVRTSSTTEISIIRLIKSDRTRIARLGSAIGIISGRTKSYEKKLTNFFLRKLLRQKRLSTYKSNRSSFDRTRVKSSYYRDTVYSYRRYRFGGYQSDSWSSGIHWRKFPAGIWLKMQKNSCEECCRYSITAIKYSSVQYNTVLHSISIVLCSIVKYRYSAVRYGTVQHCTLLYRIVQYSTVL